ncbi:MAG: hypothetical protein QM536_08310 [Chitinophagaceae bacterium]|nr:hypothetical protein [Chitinophagaceae bacterium]
MSKFFNFISFVRTAYNGKVRINFQGNIYVRSEDVFKDTDKPKKFISKLKEATIAYNKKVRFKKKYNLWNL